MERTYDLAALLRRKMIDYDFPSINAMAAYSGVNGSTLDNLMNRKHRIANLDNCRRLCAALDIHPDVLRRSMVNGWTPGTEE